MERPPPNCRKLTIEIRPPTKRSLAKKSHTENTVGPWAHQKLDGFQRYLEAYVQVMKNQPFKLFYVDAFAGAGISKVRKANRDVEEGLFLLDDNELGEIEDYILGSPMRALNVKPAFDHYRFVELDERRADELEDLRELYTDLEVKVLRGDANSKVQYIAERFHGRLWRGVAFLDPYEPNLHWKTIEALARTGKFDVVINFPLQMGINRLLKVDGQIPDHHIDLLDKCFGSRDWFDASYRKEAGLFGDDIVKRQDATERLLGLYTRGLKDVFGHVSKPSLVRNTRNSPIYYLIWAGSNGRGKVIANHILNMGERVRIKKTA